jgi:protein-L-isoaspartate(D-aspartate) O-methyltransferase
MSSKDHLMSVWEEKGLILSENILAAFHKIPREDFVPPKFKHQAYHDHPLPTIREQSISQPTTIMIMLRALGLKEGMNVFEVGAGVGYQAALISQIIGEKGKLVSSEVIPELVHIARKNLQNLGLSNTKIIEEDGSDGFLENAPYDRIIVTAACPEIPSQLINQLKDGGIIVAPVGNKDVQTLVKAVKNPEGLSIELLGPFCFVLMKGKSGFKEV